MNEFLLDGACMNELPEAHDYVARKLQFPPTYGKNLDALFDLLTTLPGHTTIVIKNAKSLDKRFFRVFADAADYSDTLQVVFK